MFGPLHVRINGCILYLLNVDNTFLKTVINKSKEYICLTKLLPTITSSD